MVFDELIEGVEFDDPQEELALVVAKHFEVLDAIGAFNGEGEVAGTRLADADEKCTVVFVGQKLFGVGCNRNVKII